MSVPIIKLNLGLDQEEMDKIVSDLKGACWDLPVSFSVVPFDDPMVCVYIRGESAGTIMWCSENPATPGDYQWWAVSSISYKTTKHGTHGLRAALARLCNDYIDSRIGLI